jgi:four helix bundle protein
MATATRFEELTVWQKARELCRMLHVIIATNEANVDTSLSTQLRRASGSVMDNIAEGFGRISRKEFLQFLFIANGSLMETKSQVYRALDFDYITKEECQSVLNVTEEISAMIYKLSKYLKSSTISGQKHK